VSLAFLDYTPDRRAQARSLAVSPHGIGTDGFGSYPPVVNALWRGHIDYAQIIKEYTSPSPDDQGRYSPATCKVTDIHVLNGEPVPDLISTSYVERQNLTMRMGMRRYTRLTNGFSKKVENLTYAVSLHYMHYNFAGPHQPLTKAARRPTTTTAMAAGVATYPWSTAQIAALLD